MTVGNTVNFLGAAAHIDSEAEYRLVSLGRDIIEAKIAVNKVSLSLKASYAESVAGDLKASRAHLENSTQNLGRARASWAKVGKEFSNTAHWLDGYMRPEYCDAFVTVAKDRDFHSLLAQENLSRSYMAPAFEALNQLMDDESSERSVLQTFMVLRSLGERISLSLSEVLSYITKLLEDEKFDIYSYIFQHLALDATKPHLFALDEALFGNISDFDIYYEAVEQIAREAHTRVPNTHDQEFERFSLIFTEGSGKRKVLPITRAPEDKDDVLDIKEFGIVAQRTSEFTSIGPTTTEVNSFKNDTSVKPPVWTWKSSPGNSCGTSRSYKYQVQNGDSFVDTGKKCSDGKPIYKITYFGTPEKQ